MSESWQNWDSPEYIEFLDLFYKMQLDIAFKVASNVSEADFYTVALKVFEKVAPPAVYLKAEYEKWRKKQEKDAIPEREPVTPKSKTVWKPTKTEGTEWCSERDADPLDVGKAKDKAFVNMWYMPPREGYQFGAIFRKVKT